MNDLNTVETLNSVLVHSVCLISLNRWDRLDETNHGSVTMSVELVIITGLKRLKFV